MIRPDNLLLMVLSTFAVMAIGTTLICWQSQNMGNLNGPHVKTVTQGSFPKVYLTYTAFGGLCNQILGHLNALAIGCYMQTDIVLPKAWSRKSFTGWAEYKEEPLNTLLDTNAMKEFWLKRGIALLQASRLIRGELE